MKSVVQMASGQSNRGHAEDKHSLQDLLPRQPYPTCEVRMA